MVVSTAPSVAAATSVSAMPTVAVQPGLSIPAPPSYQMILPSRPSDQMIGSPRWCAVPHGPNGNPIITSMPGAFKELCQGEPNQHFGQVFSRQQGGYSAAVAHILAFFSNPNRPPPPATLCLNCFLHHMPNACSSPSYAWNTLIGRGHPSCRHCGQIHHAGQPCGPTEPPPSPSTH